MSRDDLPDLPDDIAALLRDARGVGPAPASERRQIAARLTVTTGVLIPGAGLAGAKLVAVSWAARAVGVVAVLAGGAVAVGSLRAPTVPPRAPSTVPVPVVSSPRTVARPFPRAAVPTPVVPAPTPAVPAPTPPPPRAEPVTDPSLDAELALIEGAHAALARGDLAGAEAALTRHARRHARGRLAPEREALRVEVLAAQGDFAAAEDARERFHARFPRSVLGAAVDRAVQR